MAKKKQSNISIKDILKGRFLVDDSSLRHWKFVVFLAVLAFISILSSHWADKKVVEVKRLQNQVSNLKSEYAFIHKKLMQNQMRSHVAEVVAKDSIMNASVQPYKIVEK
ncbi:S-adenosyl-methyltransferase [Weeksellaceae bacterium TAE3-ERU29]|nr:S-adenosyl-methyltransferase [Weeksellaceae bacterium TAE3-ERU29]